MNKTLCKKKNKELKNITRTKAKYKCKDCGLGADKEKYLCKPKKN